MLQIKIGMELEKEATYFLFTFLPNFTPTAIMTRLDIIIHNLMNILLPLYIFNLPHPNEIQLQSPKLWKYTIFSTRYRPSLCLIRSCKPQWIQIPVCEQDGDSPSIHDSSAIH